MLSQTPDPADPDGVCRVPSGAEWIWPPTVTCIDFLLVSFGLCPSYTYFYVITGMVNMPALSAEIVFHTGGAIVEFWWLRDRPSELYCIL